MPCRVVAVAKESQEVGSSTDSFALKSKTAESLTLARCLLRCAMEGRRGSIGQVGLIFLKV